MTRSADPAVATVPGALIDSFSLPDVRGGKKARGIFHGVECTAPRIADLARAASETSGKSGATKSLPLEQARNMMGPFADALCTDQVVVTRRASELDWKPMHGPALETMPACLDEWKEAVGG